MRGLAGRRGRGGRQSRNGIGVAEKFLLTAVEKERGWEEKHTHKARISLKEDII